MNHTVATNHLDWHQQTLPSLEPADEALLADETRYCPTRLLSAFALLMAGHGRAVCTSMMLGDREYAMWQLARAHTVSDQNCAKWPLACSRTSTRSAGPCRSACAAEAVTTAPFLFLAPPLSLQISRIATCSPFGRRA